MYEVNFPASILASLYPGAFLQFVISLMGVSSLCVFTKPLIVGAVGFKFTIQCKFISRGTCSELSTRSRHAVCSY